MRTNNMALVDASRRPWILNLSILWFFLSSITAVDYEDDVFQAGNQQNVKFGVAKPTRYLLYDINPGEGFNLRRDVYIRIANLVKVLNEDEPWTLVLPPWNKLYHWKSHHLQQEKIPWATFFDVPSLGKHIPVMEFEDYIKVTGKPEIEEMYYLQRYKEGWNGGKWEEKMDKRDCIDPTYYHKDENGLWRGHFWGHDEEAYGRKFQCLSVQAEAVSMKPFLMKNTSARSVFLVRAEELIHGQYSEWSPQWWTARRSLVFAKHLRQLGDEFREKELDSTDEKDKTKLHGDWTKMRKSHGDALGGPYVALHMRRADFLYGHNDDVPSLKGTAEQIEAALKKNKLDTVFIATDAPQEEYEEIKKRLKRYKVRRYVPPKEVLEKYKDGGIAIIDQWICAHARYFMGTSVSTFTFRIHEEREILGFDPDMTFNRLCPDSNRKCEQPARWVVKYD